MKPNELMVGDWVQNTFMGNKVPCKVVGISTDITIEYQNRTRKYEALKEVEPIPLTAEILEKNGFDVMVCNDGVKLFAYESVCIKEYKGLFTFKISDCRKRINYVHELQHALKLCGIDIDIEL